MHRRLLILAVLLAAVGIAGCGSAERRGPRAIDGVFPAQGDVAPLPIRVSDVFGVIRTVSIVAADAGQQGVTQVPGRDDAFFLHWVGGMCDRTAEIVVDRTGGGLLLTISTKRDFGGCRMAGISRTLMLELNEPFDASTVSVEVLD